MHIYITPDRKAFFTPERALEHIAASRDAVSTRMRRRSGGYAVDAVLSSGRQERLVIEECETGEDIGTTAADILAGTAFPISCLSREDLEDRGFDASGATGDDMRRLAAKMGDDYCEQLFWTSLEILAELNGFEKVKDKKRRI